MAGSWCRGALLAVAFVWFPAATVQAELFRADYAIDFVPPNPIIGIDLTDVALGGALTLYYQFDPGDDPVAMPNPGPPEIPGIALGAGYTGSWLFNLDLSGGAPTFFVSFGGELCPCPIPARRTCPSSPSRWALSRARPRPQRR